MTFRTEMYLGQQDGLQMEVDDLTYSIYVPDQNREKALASARRMGDSRLPHEMPGKVLRYISTGEIREDEDRDTYLYVHEDFVCECCREMDDYPDPHETDIEQE